MDFKVLASNLGIDEDDFMELVDLFIDTSLADIEKIKTGVASGSSQDAAAAAHSIKGASGNMGFEDIFELAKDMEMQAKSGSLDNFDNYLVDLETKVNALKTS